MRLRRELLRVVVVDDEPHARADLVQILRDRADVDIVAECDSGATAVSTVERLQPDLVLLDIRMPGVDGFGVVAQLDQRQLPYVVFVTAYDRFAIEAFRVRALDYLLKPVHPARLDEALARAREQLAARRAVAREGSRPDDKYLGELLVRVGQRDIVVRVDEIDWVEADTYYARLHVGARSYLLRERMHVLETRLDPERFMRVHRSAIVNLDRVRAVTHDGRGDHLIVLTGGVRVKASRGRWMEFRSVLRRRSGRSA
jgi:two-component system LytT family response regulator